MTKNSKDPRFQLRKISDFFIEDLLKTSDAEILTEAAENIAGKIPGETAKTAYQRALQITGKKRLQVARDAIKIERDKAEPLMNNVDIQNARELLKKLAANDPEFGQKITLAARNLQNMTDSEVLGIIRDLRRLGALPEDYQL